MSIDYPYDRPDDVRRRIDAAAATEILRMLTADGAEPDPASRTDGASPFAR